MRMGAPARRTVKRGEAADPSDTAILIVSPNDHHGKAKPGPPLRSQTVPQAPTKATAAEKPACKSSLLRSSWEV